MNLQTIFDQLTSGELSQLNIGGAAAQGSVLQSGYPTLVNSINLALTAIYTRFTLKEGKETVTLAPPQEIFSLTNGDVLKIEKVLLDSGKALPLNDTANPDSVFTMAMRTLSLPKHIATQAEELNADLKTTGLTAVYRANHPKLVLATVEAQGPAAVELELPESHLQALLYHIASRLHTPLGAAGNSNPGNSFYQKFEVECQRLEGTGLQIDLGAQVDKLHARGFA